MLLLGGIRKLLHDDGLTIKGVQKVLREQGISSVADLSHGLDAAPPEGRGPSPQSDVDFDIEVAEADANATEQDRAAPEDDIKTEAEPAETAEVLSFRHGRGHKAAKSTSDADAPSSGGASEAGSDTQTTTPAEKQAETSKPAAGDLPSFLQSQRSAESDVEVPTASPASEAVPEATPPSPSSRSLPAAPPPEQDLPYSPGLLAKLVEIDRLDPSGDAELDAVMTELKALLARSDGLGLA